MQKLLVVSLSNEIPVYQLVSVSGTWKNKALFLWPGGMRTLDARERLVALQMQKKRLTARCMDDVVVKEHQQCTRSTGSLANRRSVPADLGSKVGKLSRVVLRASTPEPNPSSVTSDHESRRATFLMEVQRCQLFIKSPAHRNPLIYVHKLYLCVHCGISVAANQICLYSCYGCTCGELRRVRVLGESPQGFQAVRCGIRV